MKTFFLAMVLLLSMGCSSTVESSAPSGPYMGEISATELIADYAHFGAVYTDYQPSPAEVVAAKHLAGKTLVVLFGTWCHDSEREVPRLLKLLDVADVNLDDLSLYGVNYNKQEPNGLHREYGLQYSPTIILFDGNKELGRIVEKPQVSLGEDLANFLAD